MRRIENILNPIAELDAPDSGRVIIPQKAYVIKSEYSFHCPDHDCKDINRVLIPARSKNGVYFFKHKPGFKHEIHPETLLHKMAIKWFEKCTTYEIPCYGKIIQQTVQLDKTKTILEFRKLKRIIPDVRLATSKGFDFAVEIVVTSDMGINKKKLIEEFELPTLRVNLTDFYDNNKKQCKTNYNFVETHLTGLLTDITLKEWVIPPRNEEEFLETEAPVEENDSFSKDNTGCLVFLLALVSIFLFNKRL